MEYKTVEVDFVRRTLCILEQYERLIRGSVGPHEEYEVTLLINCLLGLIVLPFEHLKRLQNNARFPHLCDNDEVAIGDLSAEWGLSTLDVDEFVTCSTQW